MIRLRLSNQTRAHHIRVLLTCLLVTRARFRGRNHLNNHISLLNALTNWHVLARCRINKNAFVRVQQLAFYGLSWRQCLARHRISNTLHRHRLSLARHRTRRRRRCCCARRVSLIMMACVQLEIALFERIGERQL